MKIKKEKQSKRDRVTIFIPFDHTLSVDNFRRTIFED